MVAVDPTREQVKALAQWPHSGPVHMVNLLAFEPDGGIERYARYTAAVEPHLELVGGRIIAMGAAGRVFIGDDDRPWWDAILTVEYPSVAAFLQMLKSDAYQAHTHLRTEALTRAELIAVAPDTLEAPS